MKRQSGNDCQCQDNAPGPIGSSGQKGDPGPRGDSGDRGLQGLFTGLKAYW